MLVRRLIRIHIIFNKRVLDRSHRLKFEGMRFLVAEWQLHAGYTADVDAVDVGVHLKIKDLMDPSGI